MKTLLLALVALALLACAIPTEASAQFGLFARNRVAVRANGSIRARGAQGVAAAAAIANPRVNVNVGRGVAVNVGRDVNVNVGGFHSVGFARPVVVNGFQSHHAVGFAHPGYAQPVFAAPVSYGAVYSTQAVFGAGPVCYGY